MKGSVYNKESVVFINRLIEKNQIEVAYKLLHSLVKTSSMENASNSTNGRFFIKKLVNSDAVNLIEFIIQLKSISYNKTNYL